MTSRPATVWSWPAALLGVVYAVPAAAVAISDTRSGLALAVGMLPAAAVGLVARRKARLVVFLLGALTGLSLLVGAFLGQWPVAGALGLGAACVAGALASTRLPAGGVVLTLCVPLVGAGLSIDSARTGFDAFLLMTLGAAYATAVSMCWSSSQAHERPKPVAMSDQTALRYGVVLAVAAAATAAVGYLLDLDHVGWACVALLTVARPDPELLRSRGADRAGAVLVGAFVAAVVSELDPAPEVVAILMVVAMAGLVGTRGSRLYITAGFTSFFVLLMLLQGHQDATADRFLERVLETLLGVGVGLVVGLIVARWIVAPSTRAPLGRRPSAAA